MAVKSVFLSVTTPNGKLIAGNRVIRLGNVSTPTITIYKLEPELDTGTAIVIAPGGGFSILAQPVTRWHERVEDWIRYLKTVGTVGGSRMTRLLHTMLLPVIAVLFCIDEVHAQASGKSFATHGTEKMIYDAVNQAKFYLVEQELTPYDVSMKLNDASYKSLGYLFARAVFQL